MSLTLPIERVSDTAFLTAFCRAIETDRTDAHFRDPYARLLAGTRGEELLRRFPGGEATASGCIVRTCLLDDFILRAVTGAAIDVVLNLGAGLDTRPYRLLLPPSLSWIEADDPSILAYKASKLQGACAACRLERIPLDVSDTTGRRRLFQRICSSARQVLVLTEGLLVYMAAEQVASLAEDLHACGQFRCWLSDLTSPDTLRLVQAKFVGPHNGSQVRMVFAPEEGGEFFRQYGWELAEVRLCVEEAQRLKRCFFPEGLLPRLSREQWDALRRLTAVVNLKRVERHPRVDDRFPVVAVST